LTRPGWRWFPACARARCMACRCWWEGVRWGRGLPAARPALPMRSRWSVWPFRCSRLAAQDRLRARAVLRNWTGLPSRLWSCKERATSSGSRPPTNSAPWSRSPATTASGGICRQWLPLCSRGLPTSSADSASGRGGDQARAVPCRPPPEPSLCPVASAPASLRLSLPRFRGPQAPSLPPAVGLVRQGHLARLGRKRPASEARLLQRWKPWPLWVRNGRAGCRTRLAPVRGSAISSRLTC
jgi:hypothetical protein